MKGSLYQGIITISFVLESVGNRPSLKLDYKGTGVKFANINGKRLQPKEVKYS
jgi:hypothetical protein